jgi:hypothetical protein
MPRSAVSVRAIAQNSVRHVCPSWVKSGITHREHMLSTVALKADTAAPYEFADTSTPNIQPRALDGTTRQNVVINCSHRTGIGLTIPKPTDLHYDCAASLCA